MRIRFDREEITAEAGAVPIAPEFPCARPRPSRSTPARPSGLTVRHYLDLGRTESMMCPQLRR